MVFARKLTALNTVSDQLFKFHVPFFNRVVSHFVYNVIEQFPDGYVFELYSGHISDVDITICINKIRFEEELARNTREIFYFDEPLICQAFIGTHSDLKLYLKIKNRYGRSHFNFGNLLIGCHLFDSVFCLQRL